MATFHKFQDIKETGKHLFIQQNHTSTVEKTIVIAAFKTETNTNINIHYSKSQNTHSRFIIISHEGKAFNKFL